MRTTMEQFIDGDLSGDQVLSLIIDDDRELPEKLRRHGITNKELSELVIDGPTAVIRAAMRRIPPVGTYEQQALVQEAGHGR